MQPSLFGPVARGAVLSDDCAYRYRLWRIWSPSRPQALWVLLNPSTADAYADDPTIRRCEGFTRAWGLGGFEVVNLYAYRATDPSELARATDPIGPENDRTITVRARRPDVSHVVCAWGASAPPGDRATEVIALLRIRPIALWCLGTTKDGHPRHPLYIAATVPLVPFGATV